MGKSRWAADQRRATSVSSETASLVVQFARVTYKEDYSFPLKENFRDDQEKANRLEIGRR